MPNVTLENEIERAGEKAPPLSAEPIRAPRVAAPARSYIMAALFGGLLVFAIEAVDRIATLWPSFNSPREPFFYAAYLAPALLLGLVGGLAIAAVVGAVGLARSLVARALPARWRVHDLAATVATALAIACLLWIASALFPGVVERPLLEVARKINLRVTPIPYVVKHFAGFFVAAALVVGLALAAIERLMSWRPAGGGRRMLAALALVGIAGVAAIYALDSRIQFGRYELTLHLPAVAATLALAFVTGGLAVAALELYGLSRRALARFAVLVLVAAVAASGLAVWHLGTNENLKALLWRRSVIARRAYEVAALAVDRDRDGATSLFAGTDVDDRNPAVHPFASEIPGNGVDENCFGGDGEATARDPAPGAAAEPTGYDFVLIALDTLRASRMSVYGYTRMTTPRIAEYAMRGRLYTNAYSAGSNTGLSFATMQRSATRAAVFGKARPTLFGTLAAAGYVTAQVNAASDSRWLAPRTWRRYRKVIMTGIANVTHREDAGRWDADRVTDEAIRYIDALPVGTRHATWVHYLDQHEPRRKFAPYDYGDAASDVYDSTVAFTDHEVGRLLDYLRDSGRLDRTVVVLMSDHGESFDEHGMNEHGNRPYLEQVRVPTIVWAPGVAPARSDVPVTTTDIAPTVLDALGLPPMATAEGRSLVRDFSARAIYAETPANLPQPSFFSYAVTDGSWRLIWDVRGNTLELYDTASDPGELHNLADAEPERLTTMKRLLARWLDSTEAVRQFGKHDAGGE